MFAVWHRYSRIRDVRSVEPGVTTRPQAILALHYHEIAYTQDALLFFFQAEDGIRDWSVTGVQTCALPILAGSSCSRTQQGPGQEDDQGLEGSGHRSERKGKADSGTGPGEQRERKHAGQDLDRKSVV